MSAAPKSAAASPPPVFARRHAAPQYLAPGQHLKVASRKPPSSSATEPPPGPPRDPWESEEDDIERGIAARPDVRQATRTAPPAAATASASTSYPWGGRATASRHPPQRRPSSSSDHHHHNNNGSSGSGGGGHPFSSHLSRSRGSLSSEAATPCKAEREDSRSQTDMARDGKEGAGSSSSSSSCGPAAAAHEAELSSDTDGDDAYYHHTEAETPQLTAAERAQQVLELQQRALETKQLQALTQQGVARRPKTLVRNRHGRLQAIAAASPAASTEAAPPALLMDAAPVVLKSKPRPQAGRRDAPKKARETAPATPPAVCGHDDLVNSRPATPTKVEAEKLEIDLD